MSITYEDIKQANDAIRTLTISRTDKKTGETVSKEYAEVNQRIKAFRMIYPDGFIETAMIHDGTDLSKQTVCYFCAKVGFYNGDKKIVLGTGHAYEKESSSFINQTSYIENCETSAVGRALGMAGFGIDTSVASAEEVQNAMINQQERKATEKQVAYLAKVYTGENLKKLLETQNITKLEDISFDQASGLISKLTKK